tara:strand:+ start:1403 stop:1705 length:303 start_codon:yes stop_codon:yes gene_type:complete
MVIVIFEFTVKPGKEDSYFEIAAEVQAEVEKIDGFLGVERFQSTVYSNKFVSLSRWRDEAEVKTWCDQCDHKIAQGKGKREILERFLLRTVKVLKENAQN